MQERKKRLWTPEMENELIKLNSLDNMSNREIGKRLGGLKAEQVGGKKRGFFTVSGKVAARGKRFTPKEDEELIVYCTTHRKGNGSIMWNKINEYLPGRSIRQCRDRWLNNLSADTNISKPWTKEEDGIILKNIKKFGSSDKIFSILGKQLERSKNSIKIHYYKSLRQVLSPNKLKTMQQQLNVNKLLIQETKVINEALYDVTNNNIVTTLDGQEQNNQI